MTRHLFPPLAVVAALAFGVIATPVRAEEPGRAAVEVRYADLDLTSEPGADVMLRRLDRAARQICGLTPAQRFGQQQARACHALTLRKSVDKVDAPLVTQIYAQRQGQRMVFAAR